jgi:2,4-dienoyl-CoA reductase-like NADH-dependent reductase (Old Yellow Enzyme family)
MIGFGAVENGGKLEIMSGQDHRDGPHGLFDPLTIRGITLRNRIIVSPMCQYSCEDGMANDWHFVHLGSRISPQDLGLWSDAHIEPLARIVRFVHSQGSMAGIQLAHAGRKASTARPWEGSGLVSVEQGGWKDVVAPSALPFSSDYPMPAELSTQAIAEIVRSFGEAARRARQAGYRVVEIHAAHGYLLHSFFSPLSNRRTDAYGGTFENRTRIGREVTEAVRKHWPEKYPLFIRVSATDWTEGGWGVEQAVELARALQPLGVDLVDCSSGGNVPSAKIPFAPGYQTGFAERIRRGAGVLAGAVGMITSAVQAEHILRTRQADVVLLARQMLRDPYWPLHAAIELGQEATWPVQYLRAAPRGTTAREPVAQA